MRPISILDNKKEKYESNYINALFDNEMQIYDILLKQPQFLNFLA